MKITINIPDEDIQEILEVEPIPIDDITEQPKHTTEDWIIKLIDRKLTPMYKGGKRKKMEQSLSLKESIVSKVKK